MRAMYQGSIAPRAEIAMGYGMPANSKSLCVTSRSSRRNTIGYIYILISCTVSNQWIHNDLKLNIVIAFLLPWLT